MSHNAGNISESNSSSKSIIFSRHPTSNGTTTVDGEGFTVRVLTLNCWGLWLGAKKRNRRMTGIVSYLRKSNCDIVFLQEVWVTSDFEAIRDGTNDIYHFAHLYKSGSVLGSSGIVILCKWIPKVIHFEPYSLNGSPFYPWHGDWFAGKGIAYSRVDFEDISLHLFSTHTHAYYKEYEPVHDQYFVHRICQSYQLARFITFISDTACNRKVDGKDLLIVAGDMNTTSTELPYKILTTMANLTDCFKTSRNNNSSSNIIHKHKIITYTQKSYYTDNGSTSSSNSHGDNTNTCVDTRLGDIYPLEHLNSKVLFDSDTEDEDITYCHPRNSFTPTVAQPYRYIAFKFSSAQSKRSPMKRIDFILCRLLANGHCVVDRIPQETKDPSLDCSLSDHEPVMVELKIRDAHTKKVSSNCQSNIEVLKETQDVLMKYHAYSRKTKTQLLYFLSLIFVLTLPVTTYYALANELIPASTIIFIWLAASFLLASGILIGFLNYRFELGAIEAILNDITRKLSISNNHQ